MTVNLVDGVLTDAKGRIGAIVANYQFQFDGPPAQTGSIYTAGFSACGNGSLALGGSAVFYQCYSGGFYNLYDRHWAAQCNPILLDILPCAGSSSGVGQSADGQPTGTATGVATQYVHPLSWCNRVTRCTRPPAVSNILFPELVMDNLKFPPPPPLQFRRLVTVRYKLPPL